MKALLDTNAFVRWRTGSVVPTAVRRLMGRPELEVLISIVTAWEIAMKTALGISANDVESAIVQTGASVLPIKFAHLNELSTMPTFRNHRDPFDRLLIAQALAENVPIVSSDTRFSGYKRLRVIWD